ncbi:hypothetical protein [Rhizohabitans arisaemae]|uniref:hypothetical protein n=1 Tax=Rhizohabitans arisaemae TaxID=2720610 RepID=UPI0024B24221|nr:hypothetical protein [Rhizohabitans arisaemae]
MSDTDWTQVVGTIGIFALLTSVITVIIWQLASTRRAKTLLVREHEYRKIAEDGLATQQSIERRLAELDEHLAETRTRLASIERILQQVE